MAMPSKKHKRNVVAFSQNLMFESRVILDGSQTSAGRYNGVHTFESRVILDGSQTPSTGRSLGTLFESRVILDGSQTHGRPQ